MKREKIKELKRHEKHETRSEEKRESSKTQKMEKKYGIEKHNMKGGHTKSCPPNCKKKHG